LFQYSCFYGTEKKFATLYVTNGAQKKFLCFFVDILASKKKKRAQKNNNKYGRC